MSSLSSELPSALFRSSGANGVYGRTGLYERVATSVDALISQWRPPEAEIYAFPPVMSRSQIERQGYLKSFPNLLGVVSCLCGDERHIRRVVDRANDGQEWTAALQPTDLVLSPAACYPVYPMAAARGPLDPAGLVFDVSCVCFRREPSTDIDRLQSFRMREFVRIGARNQALEFRDTWIGPAREIAKELGLEAEVKTASDPFFGRGGELVAQSQLEQSLKFELLVPIRPGELPTACMSFNYHQEHFGLTWDIRDQAGAFAHSACVAFGVDRITLALFAAHGLSLEAWPDAPRNALRL